MVGNVPIFKHGVLVCEVDMQRGCCQITFSSVDDWRLLANSWRL